MKKGRLAVCTLICIGFLVCVGSANAQTQITLGGSTQAITFTGLGSGNTTQEAITLGHCVGATCTLGGTAFGTGGVTSGPAPYSLTSTLGSLVMTLANSVTGLWTVAQSAPILFSYGMGGSLLTGDLNLLTFQETPGTKQGTFNVNETANLAITGGSLAGAFGSNGVADVLITFTTTANVISLLGTTNSLSATDSSGELIPTPEPSGFAIFLLGAGTLLIGSLLRRRSFASTA
jgi:hypothetical protein